jgi:hypothetical protein
MQFLGLKIFLQNKYSRWLQAYEEFRIRIFFGFVQNRLNILVAARQKLIKQSTAVTIVGGTSKRPRKQEAISIQPRREQQTYPI